MSEGTVTEGVEGENKWQSQAARGTDNAVNGYDMDSCDGRGKNAPWSFAMIRRTAMKIGVIGLLTLAAGMMAWSPRAAVKTYEIGVIAKSNSNPVFQAAKTGAEDAARDLGKKLGVEIKINWRTPNSEDAQQQSQYMEQLAAQGVAGIAVSCSDGQVLKSAIDSAVAKGVEVVTFDSDSPSSKRMAYYGINDEDAGKFVMDELAKAMGEKGVVAVLAGNQNAPNLQARVRAVREAAKKYPGIRIKDVYYHVETPTDAAAKVQQVQTANPDITGWAMVGGWPLFTKNALDGVYQNAKVVAVDHLEEQLEYVRKGQVQVLLGQDCYGWGYQSVVMLMDKIHDGKKPEKVINTFKLAKVTKENVEEYAGLWNKWLRKSNNKKD